MKLSFVITLKNRINMKYNDGVTVHIMHLFEKNLASLCSIIKPEDEWEFVVVDFGSTDADVEEFLKSSLIHPNMTYKLIILNEPFSRGKGLNVGIDNATHDIVFCYDTDMVINTYELFDDIQTYVVNEGKALFPICWSYHDITHTTGWKRDTGLGMVIYNKNIVTKYIEKQTWGREDDINYKYFCDKGIEMRTYYGQQYYHQWHPINRKGDVYID
jgi:glycosyltransferase involved in cell wall biosynthesis